MPLLLLRYSAPRPAAGAGRPAAPAPCSTSQPPSRLSRTIIIAAAVLLAPPCEVRD